jgi:hypothetical protein
MLTPSLPRSLADLLIVFRPCFTAPTFATFRAMVAGFLAQPGLRTVNRDAGWRRLGRPPPPRPGLPVLRHRPLVG